MPHTPASPDGQLPRIFYQLGGEGPIKILFTMGLAGTHLQWEPQWDYFTSRPQEYQVCVYDNRGVGLSESVGGRWTTAAMAQDALRLLDHLGWTARRSVHLVGMSMGGMITLELALADPVRFGSLTLIASTAGGPLGLLNYVRVAPQGLLSLVRLFASRDAPQMLNHGLEILFPKEFLEQTTWDERRQLQVPNAVRMAKALIRRARRSRELGMKPPAQTAVRQQVLAVTTHRVSAEQLAALSRHFVADGRDAALVVTGLKDGLVHPANSRILRRGLRCRSLVVPDAGHGVNEQCADAVNAALRDNIARGLRAASWPEPGAAVARL